MQTSTKSRTGQWRHFGEEHVEFLAPPHWLSNRLHGAMCGMNVSPSTELNEMVAGGAYMFDRNLWSEVWAKDNMPKFPCPTCKSGRLIFVEESLRVEEPQYSKTNFDTDDWEPGMEEERFTLFLHCDSAGCGEFSACAGDTTAIEDIDENENWCLISVLRPNHMFPAPSLIEIDENVPTAISKEIKRAFSLFWCDLDASANRLRVSAERLLDHLTVPTTTIDKKGKTVRLDLNGRIAVFSKTSPEHEDTLTAMRLIGNLGSHGSGVVREALLDAFEVYEDCLHDLVGQRKQRLAALRAKLIQSKAKY